MYSATHQIGDVCSANLAFTSYFGQHYVSIATVSNILGGVVLVNTSRIPWGSVAVKALRY